MIIWLASYPKSGNTWLRMFLRAYLLPKGNKFSINYKGNQDFESSTFPNVKLLKSSKVDHLKFDNIIKNWVNLQDIVNLNGKINFLKTHNGNYTVNNYPFTNTQNTIGGIYLVRDPRDVLLSFSNHLKLSYEEVFEKMVSMDNFEFDETDPDLKGGYIRSLLGSWSNHYLSWKSFKGRDLLFLKYEDLVKNPYKNFYKVLTYLKNFVPLELDSEKIRSSIEITSFKNLKKNEEDEGFIEQGMSKEFFRKGIIGDWKSNLKPELLYKIESKFKKEMIELGYI